MNVLVVDDNATARNLLLELLSDIHGVDGTAHASSGEAAVERTQVAVPDLVVMDWSMPGMDGVQTTARIRANHPRVRIVGWTSTDDPVVHRAFTDAGAEAVFVKERVGALLRLLSGAATRQQ